MAPQEPETFYGESDTLAPFVSCAIQLGEPVARAAASMFAGRLLAYPGEGEDPPFVAFAILLPAAFVERRPELEAWLNQMVQVGEGRRIPRPS